MVLLRDQVLSCLRHNIFFQARHIPGLQNSSADYISRSQVENFKAIFPEADKNRTPLTENQMPKNCLLSSPLTASSCRTYQHAWTVFR